MQIDSILIAGTTLNLVTQPAPRWPRKEKAMIDIKDKLGPDCCCVIWMALANANDHINDLAADNKRLREEQAELLERARSEGSP